MGFMDKIKGAMNAVTGNAAKVSLEFNPATGFPGDKVSVKVTATSTGQEVKSQGVFIDLVGTEKASIKKSQAGTDNNVDVSRTSHEQPFPIAPAFVLAPNETKTWEAEVILPTNIQPSFAGEFVRHEWTLRGRIEATGNDPDSGHRPFRIGLKN